MSVRKSVFTPAIKQNILLFFMAIIIALVVVPIIIAFFTYTNKYFSLVLAFGQNFPSFVGYWWLIIPMLIGGLIVGLIVHKIAPETEGPGTHIVLAAYHKRNGQLRLRTGPSKFIASLITLGSGSPNGLVSPSLLLGNSISSYFGWIMELDNDKKKTLTLCGVASAISTLLAAPIGAAIFAVEVIYGDHITYRRFFYCLVSSLTAYIFALWLGFHGLYRYVIIDLPALTLEIIAIIAITALIVTVVNILYIELYQKIHNFFLSRSWKGRDWLEPILGMGAAAIIIAPL